MSSTELIFLIFGGLIIFFFLKRFLTVRSLTHYSTSEVKELLKKNNGTILLDVRTKSERSNEHIKNSLHIPLNELRNRITELNKVKEKEIICYCASGNRSVSAAALLKKSGLKSANLKGGISAWNFNT